MTIKKRFYTLFFQLIIICSISCTSVETESTEFNNAPEWTHNVVWYQIFVERFRNGDTSNDPTPLDMIGSYPGQVPENWETTPWTHDWYAPDSYWGNLDEITDFGGNTLTYFGQKAQLRRYGGDLQGVLDKIDYLDSLGVTAIFFNPLNDAPSLHKYDARNWHHIDRNFGPSPKEDIELIATENPTDPTSWVWTGADKLFTEIIDELHNRGIRVIMDYSWNHTGLEFWAWKDLVKNGKNSEYADWYWVDAFDNPQTPENEFSYSGWLGVPSLPEIKETERQDHTKGIRFYEGNIYLEEVKQHIFATSKRWLDPNGDGDPSDGVDGFRLDVAAEVPLGFWREYREMVRSVNPEAYLVGEIWWEEFPDKLLDPEPALRGDVFDAVMNYRWYRSTRHFFNQSPDKIPVSEYVDSLKTYMSGIRTTNNYAMMNLTASHDVPRFSTSIYNKNKYKYQAKPDDNPDYKIDQPDAETWEIMKLILVQQFTYVGAPHIWNGDEMGMWGADDPSGRKPLIWPDYEFEDEAYHPHGLDKRPINEVRFNREWFDFYRKLVHLRTDQEVLQTGELKYLLIDDERELLAYSRFNEETEIIVVFNTSEYQQTVNIPTTFEGTFVNLLTGEEVTDLHDFELDARSAAVLGVR